MDVDEELEVAIIGGGICGLATALALHRKGVRSVVLERSDSLRATGGGIGILTNGWRALDQLGVGSKLRPTSLPLQSVRDVTLGSSSSKERKTLVSDGEARCLKRSDLVKALADELPQSIVRFGCNIVSLKLDTLSSYPILHLQTGSTIRARVLIGCDGANSVVADFLELKPKKVFTSCAVRAFTEYPNGHGLAPEFVRLRKGQILSGRVPVDNKLVFWFVSHQHYPKESRVVKDPELIRELALEKINGFPTETVEMIRNCDLSTISLTQLRYCAPWDILLSTFRKGTVTVAGDAMHAMGPFIGQGGSAAIEDAVVLARCLAGRLNSIQKVGEAMDEYVKERRMRLFKMSTQTYLFGLLLENSSMLVKLIVLALFVVLFRDPIAHTRYDCGQL
ncbi:putative monooxygenase [Tripterygium wilfordii]|uniref:Putative monooxygenase n=1 Tax=Tripterygium wilfordii TaxID=458696 RepID=A0A7J7C7Z6_TRIWF|nr:monooxygenase 1-like [Tripterygium wilfordii]KAF5730259.1 putative monooxygenase [Tripterygium wilfordii]